MQHSIGALVCPQYGQILNMSNGLEVLVYAAMSLRWSHAGAMCHLQGMNPKDILGPGWLVINGSHTPPGYTMPGINRPILAKVLKNPSGVCLEDVFKEIWQTLGLSA